MDFSHQVFQNLRVLKKEYLDFMDDLKGALVILYTSEKILFVNTCAMKTLGYSKEEILKIAPSWLFRDAKVPFVKNTKLKNQDIFLENLKLNKKNGAYIYSRGYFYPVRFEERSAILAVLFENTLEVRLSKLAKELVSLNHELLKAFNQEDFLKKVCEAIGKALEADFVTFCMKDESRTKFFPIVSYGIDFSEIKDIFILLNKIDFPENKNFVFKNITSYNKIKNKPLIQFLKKFDLKNYAIIKILNKQEIFGVIFVMSKFEDFYSEKDAKIFEIINQEISYFAEKLEILRQNLIAREIFRNIEEIVLMFDEKGNLEYLNEHAYRVLEITKKGILKTALYDLKFDFGDKFEHVEKGKTRISKQFLESIIKLPVKYTLPDGREKWFEFNSFTVRLPFESLKYVLIGRDITKEKEFEDIIKSIKYKDDLTGILSFEGFTDEVRKLLEVKEIKAALVVIDLCNFVYINSRYGYSSGDYVFKVIAERLEKIPNSIASRITADTFALFVTGLTEKEEIYKVIEFINQAIKSPVKLENGEQVYLQYNAGIAFYPENGEDFLTLWKNANIALVEARAEGEGAINFFDKEMEEKVDKFLDVYVLIKKAIENNYFTFHYQPYIDVNTLEIKGLEALVRIKTPDGIIHYPGEFIEYLEKSSFLQNFELWALQYIIDVIKQISLNISINICPESLKEEEVFKTILKKIESLNGLGVEVTTRMTIEITERILATNFQLITSILKRLKKHNVRVAIDDFGTGYSSLNYIKNLPIDVLKIDKIFIDDLEKDEKSYKMVKIIIEIAKTFGIKTIAEGVETKSQYDLLKKIGCDYVQGFLIARPMDLETLKVFLKEKPWKERLSSV